jgi:hypothetical protein
MAIPMLCRVSFFTYPPLQDAEKDLQQRSRIARTLNVPKNVRLGSSLAAALLEGLFDHPA